MEAAAALDGSHGVTLPQLRTLIGSEVAAHTPAGSLEGTLLSCTTRSAWIVVDDLDHVVPLPHLLAIHRR